MIAWVRPFFVTVHALQNAADNSPARASAPEGPARSVLSVHDEPDRGRKPILRGELAAVVTKPQNLRERLLFFFAIVSILSATFLTTGAASAQSGFDGMWKAGPTQIDVLVKSWGEDCGRRPTSTKTAEGGEVRIAQKSNHLYIYGRDRTISTDVCWSPNKAMSLVSASFLNNVWTLKCRTHPDDPKGETGDYTVKANGNSLYYKDMSNYNWELKESNCVATITTTQTLTRINKNASQTKNSKESLQPAQKKEPCQPQAAAKLILQPRRAEIAPGQRICLRAHVEDALGCIVPNQQVEWSLQHSKALRGQLIDGCFKSADNAAEAEGDFRVIVSLGALRAQSLIVVTPVDLSGIIARRMESAAISGFEKDEESERTKPEAAIEITERKVKVQPFSALRTGIVLVGGAAVVFLLGFLIWLKRRPQNTGGLSAELSETLSGVLTDTGGDKQESNSEHLRPTTSQQWICPTCRHGYSSETRICPKDSTRLVPYDKFIEERKAHQGEGKLKKCPKCGEIYSPAVAFCAKDGAALIEKE